MADDVDAVDARVAKPQSTTADGVSTTRRSVSDEIAWLRLKRDQAAAASPASLFRGMNTTLVPPGAQ